MALAFIGLGSNLGDGRANLRAAWQRLAATPGITALRLSRPYATAPVEMESPHWFTNAAGALETRLDPGEVLAVLLAIEQALGRDRSQGRDRTVDLDLLLYDDQVLTTPELTLPHPEMSRRLFVLAPLEELAPDHRHPVSGQTIRQLRRQLAHSGQEIRQCHWEGNSDTP